MSTLIGPIVEPQSNEKPKQLIIFCHGYGADGNDLIGLSSYFQNILERAMFSILTHIQKANKYLMTYQLQKKRNEQRTNCCKTVIK